MSYTVNYSTSTKSPITIATATIDNSTSISLIGKNVSGFGEQLAENFLHMLENFASPVQPVNPIEGQLWYDTGDVDKKVLKIKSGVASDWRPVSNIYFQTTEPSSAISGELWVKYEDSNLSFYTYVSGTGWLNIAASATVISTSSPLESDIGRLWFNPSTQKLYVYTGTWVNVLSPAIYSSSTPTENIVTGQIWYNNSNSIPFIYNGSSWIELVSAVTNLNTEGNVNFDGGTFTFNDSNQDRDSRFAGVSDNNLLFTDASEDRVGIGTNTPRTKLEVSGTVTATSLLLANPLTTVYGGTGISNPGALNNVLSSDGAGNWTSTAITTLVPVVPDSTDTTKGIIELATTSEVQIGTDTTRAITASTLRGGSLVFDTIKSPSSGTTADFTGIPSWAKRITVMFDSLILSTNNASLNLRLGVGGVVETSSYTGAKSYVDVGGAAASTWGGSAMELGNGNSADGTRFDGFSVLTRLSASSNTWVLQSVLADPVGNRNIWSAAGTKSLAGTLDTVQVLISSGNFSSGNINIMYE